MNRREWLAAFLIAAVSIAGLMAIGPHLGDALMPDLTIGRADAIRIAAGYSRQLGYDVHDWKPSVDNDSNQTLHWWQLSHQGEFDRMALSEQVNVVFQAPSDKRRLTIHLSGDGRWVGYAVKDPSAAASAASSAPGDMELPARAMIRSLMKANKAEEVSERFQVIGRRSKGEQQTLTWKYSQSGSPLNWNIRIESRGNQMMGAKLEPDINDATERNIEADRLTTYLYFSAGVMFLVLANLMAILGMIVAFIRRRVPYRMLLTVGLICAAFIGLTLWADAGGDNKVPLALAAVTLLWLFIGGHFLLPREEQPRWRSFHLLLKGKVLHRSVGESILVGLLYSGLWPLLFTLVMVMMPRANVVAPMLFMEESAFGGSPGLLAFQPWRSLGDFTFFLFLLPFLRRLWKDSRFSALLLLVAGAICLLTLTPWLTSFAAMMFVLVLGVALRLIFYQRYGLLSTLTLAMSTVVILHVMTYAYGPITSLHAEASLPLAILGGMGAASGLVSWRGRTGDDEESVADSSPDLFTSTREQLQNEFALARLAQQKMLPQEVPYLPGFELAGECLPAREVGGDLYDYLTLRDGRHAICLADVSGKGTSAALYMTLTKGVLTALVEETSDLTTLARQLNKQIYLAARRKIFVTMALGVLDPVTKEVEYVRAGHNPVIWRRTAKGETRMLEAPGMGLGFAKDVFFQRSLRVERLQLESGDALVLYSDGITEGMNLSSEQFGEERLMSAIVEADGWDAARTCDHVLSRLAEFVGDAPPHDDRTVVVLRVK